MSILPKSLCFVFCVTCLHWASASKHSVPTFSGRLDSSGKPADVDHPSFKALLEVGFAGKNVTRNLSGQLTVNQTTVADGDDVLVSWSGISDVKISDWIGIYCSADAAEPDYIDYMYANVSSTWKTGEGSFPIKLFNMREDYQFRYYQTVDRQYHVAAISPRVSVVRHEACHGHLSYGEELSTMVLMWTTDSDHDLTVEYSMNKSFANPTTLPASAISTATYTAKQMCGAPASTVSAIHFRDPGLQVTAVISHLSASTRYYYRYGTKGSPLQTGNFKTRSPPGTPSGRFIAFGDMGVHYRPYYWEQPGAPMIGEMLAEEAQNSDIDAILHFGDLAYGVSHGYIWDQWGWLMSASARYVPYMIGVGNHEHDHLKPSPEGKDVSGVPGPGFHPSWGNINDDSFGECSVPPFYRFKMPSEHNGGNSIFWYSFDVHNVRFMMMSSEHDYSPGTNQYTWMEKVLASTDRRAFPWVVLMLHRPMYSNESDANGDNVVANHERELFEDLVMKYKVNLMVSGHYHSYQRSCPVYKGVCKPDGTAPVHVVVGTAGANLELHSTFPASWTRAGYIKFGYSIIETNSTHMRMDWITQDVGTTNKRVLDSVDIPLWKGLYD